MDGLLDNGHTPCPNFKRPKNFWKKIKKIVTEKFKRKNENKSIMV